MVEVKHLDRRIGIREIGYFATKRTKGEVHKSVKCMQRVVCGAFLNSD